MITRPLMHGVWRPLEGVRSGDQVLAMLVDPNDGVALTSPTGEAWVQWITVPDGVWTPAARFEQGQMGIFIIGRPTHDGEQVLWQDMARTIPATAHGDPVRVVDDLSPNKWLVHAPSDAARPILTMVDGVYRVRFNGSSHYLVVENGSALQSIDHPIVATLSTSFINPAGGSQTLFGNGSTSSGGNNPFRTFWLHKSGADNNVFLNYLGAEVSPADSTVLGARNVITVARGAGAVGLLRGRLNGVDAFSVDDNFPRATQPVMEIGRSQHGAFYANIDFYGAVFVVDDYILEDVEKTEAYLHPESTSVSNLWIGPPYE